VTELTILIHGESGTGKELFASGIHATSKRASGPFLAVDLGAFSDDLIESELFGYREGAFTGARKGGKPGLFELADGGTLFLDEIGNISPKVQKRLLRVLQEKEIMRVGGSEIIKVDVRIITATNEDLLEKTRERTFREDLYYRLKMGWLSIPALRERKVDIPLLVRRFLSL
jgi:transcriptional regulator with PAS, ATPase and Fis domain